MRTATPRRVIDVLMPHTRKAILAATLLLPDKSWYLQDLARHLRLRPSTLQRELAALVGAGILKSHRQGRMVYYQADSNCPVYPELQGLLAKTAGLVDVLRDCLSDFVERIVICFIYGSVARREETSLSDVDLLIVGRIGLADLGRPLRDAQEKLGREISPKLYRPDEFAKRIATKDHFLASVLKMPKIFVIGDPRALDQVIEIQPSDG